MHLWKNILCRCLAFAVCAAFVLLFVAREHDRIRQSDLLLRGSRDGEGFQYRFQADFPGFSAFSCKLDKSAAVPAGSGPLELELRQRSGETVVRETVPDAGVLAETPVWFRFPASAGPGEWQLTVRSGGKPSSLQDKGLFPLRGTLYAGKRGISAYWYGILAAGIFFLVLALAEYFWFRPAEPGGPKRPKADFDYGIHYFRAFAILIILILHYRFHTHSFRQLNDTLFSSASYFFVFISGYLFYYLTRRFEAEWSLSTRAPFLQIRTVSGRFSTVDYYRKKFLNILLPYLLISSLLYFYVLLFSDETMFTPAVPDFLPDFLFRLRTGAMQRSFWYIYFIAKVFLISPLLLYLPRKWFSVLTLLACGLPFVFDRTASHFLYFLPMYMLGMWYAANRDQADRFLFRKPVVILFFVLTGAGLLYVNRHLEPQNGMVFLTRLAMIVLLLYGTSLLRKRNIPWLSRCAEISFTLFFIHDFIYAYVHPPLWKLFSPLTASRPVFEILILVIQIAAVCLLAECLRCLFGRFSRRVIGS